MSFTDSPEDLIARARRVANAGKIVVDEQPVAVAGAVCVLLLDMARVVEAERAGRASTAEIIKQSNIREGQAIRELEQLRRRRRLAAAVPIALLVVSAVLFVLSFRR
jgi:hypothetical protein